MDRRRPRHRSSFGASARGQAKTDVVTLGNGDRITGEIEKVSRGHLELSTDDAGTIEFEWSKIATAESIRQFEVITSDGRHLFGSLGRTTASQFVRIVSTGVDESLPVSDVTELTPIGAGFWAKLDGSVDAGFSYTRSSGIAQTTFNSNTVFRRPSSMFRLTTSATLTQARDDSERDDRGTLDMSWMRYRGPRWFVVGAGRLETNESLGLVLRSEIGGVGLRLVNTNRAQFAVNGGLVVNDEIGVDTPETQNLEALFDMRTSFYSRPTQDKSRRGLQLLPEPQRLGPPTAAV
jgi:hypothetical protein